MTVRQRRDVHVHAVGEWPTAGRQFAGGQLAGPIRGHDQRRQDQRDLRRHRGGAPSDATLKTGTYTFEPPVLSPHPSARPAEYTRRKMMEFPVDPYKVRVHIANYNLFNDQLVEQRQPR